MRPPATVQRKSDARRRLLPLLLLLLLLGGLSVVVTLHGFVGPADRAERGPRSPLSSPSREAPAHEAATASATPAAEATPDREETVAADGSLVRIEGHVYTPEGLPAPQARVVACDQAVAARYLATTAEDGSFAIDVPRGRVYELAAISPAGAPVRCYGVLPPCRADLVLNEGARITGRATDRRTGAGVASVLLGLELGVQSGMGDDPLGDLLALADFSATTDAEGAFAFDGVPPGSLSVVVLGGPVRVGGGGAVDVRGPGTARCGVRVDVAMPTTLLGRVCDKDDGTPLEGAVVSARGGATARTDPLGVFRLEVSPGHASLRVVAEGRPPVEWAGRVGDARVPVEVRVPRYVTITGRVVGPDDRPIAGALVRWIGKSGPSAPRTVGEDGAFAIAGVVPGEPGVVRAEARGFAAGETATDDTVAILRLDPGAKLEGLVLGPDGGPAIGVPVVLLPGGWTAEEQDDDMELTERRVTRTDAQGRYSIEDLPQGGAWVYAVPEDRSLAPAGVRAVAPGAAPDLVLGRGRTVRGEVLDREGRPLAGATVRLFSELRGAEAVTGARGEFVLPARPAIDESIVVTLRGFAPAFAELSAEEPIVVTMTPR